MLNNLAAEGHPMSLTSIPKKSNIFYYGLIKTYRRNDFAKKEPSKK